MSDKENYQQKYSKCRQREEKLKAELATLKSRLEEATKELKGADKVINEQWATGIAVEAENVELKSRLEEAERVIDFMAAEIQRGIGCYACTYEKTCELMVDADECEQWTWRGEQEGSE